ncbi:hypothetical protein LBMAG56_09000 [Verrucomicrobiota bacterium]|nr:hypothetical protein LBMAG56_09000 [Verrucomicrobiota bacterium]
MPAPILTIALNNLSATTAAHGSTVQVTDVTTLAPNTGPSNATLMDFFIQTTNTQPPSTGYFDSKNVPGIAINGAAYTRADGSRSLTIPASTAPGNSFIVARLRAYPTVFKGVAITIT